MSQRPSSFAIRHEPHRVMTTTGAISPGVRRGAFVMAAGNAVLAYALLAPKFFATRHPVWGAFFALGSVLDIAYAVSD